MVRREWGGGAEWQLLLCVGAEAVSGIAALFCRQLSHTRGSKPDCPLSAPLWSSGQKSPADSAVSHQPSEFHHQSARQAAQARSHRRQQRIGRRHDFVHVRGRDDQRWRRDDGVAGDRTITPSRCAVSNTPAMRVLSIGFLVARSETSAMTTISPCRGRRPPSRAGPSIRLRSVRRRAWRPSKRGPAWPSRVGRRPRPRSDAPNSHGRWRRMMIPRHLTTSTPSRALITDSDR